MAWFHDLKSDVQNAIKWFAAEFHYLKELKEELEKIKQDTAVSEQERDYKRIRHTWYYIGRCERRAERNVRLVIEELKKEIQTNPNLVTIEKQIEISSEQLLKAFSFYTGDFKNKLVNILVDIKIRKGKSGDKAQAAEINMRQIADEAEQYIDTLIQWVGGLEASLNQLDTKNKEPISGLQEELRRRIALITSSEKFFIRLCSRMELFKIVQSGLLENYKQFIFYRGSFSELIERGNFISPIPSMSGPLSGWIDFACEKTEWNTTTNGLRYLSGILNAIDELHKQIKDRKKFFIKLQKTFFWSNKYPWWSKLCRFQMLAMGHKSSDEAVKFIVGIFMDSNPEQKLMKYDSKARQELLSEISYLRKLFSLEDLKILANLLGNPDYLAEYPKMLRNSIEILLKINNIQTEGGPYSHTSEKYFQGYDIVLVFNSNIPKQGFEGGSWSENERWGRLSGECDAHQYLIGIIVIIPLRNFVEDIINLIKSDKSKVKIPIYDSKGVLRYPV